MPVSKPESLGGAALRLALAEHFITDDRRPTVPSSDQVLQPDYAVLQSEEVGRLASSPREKYWSTHVAGRSKPRQEKERAGLGRSSPGYMSDSIAERSPARSSSACRQLRARIGPVIDVAR